MKKITLLTALTDCPYLASSDIGLLFECATDSELGIRYKDAIPAIQLIGDLENTVQSACILANKLLQDEPCFRGIPQLSIFHEVITDELQRIFHIIYLHDFLINAGYTVCEFLSPSWWSEGLSKLVVLSGSILIVSAPLMVKKNKIHNCIKRIISGICRLSIVFTEFKRGFDYLDPYHYRNLFINRFKKIKVNKNECWVYSTSINYTNIALSYEPYFPTQFTFLIENKETGGRPLIEKNRLFHGLYGFSKKTFIPKALEIETVSLAIQHHLLGPILESKDSLARKLLLTSSVIVDFYKRHLPLGLFYSSVFNYWLDLTEPSMLVVGNNVYEAYALWLSRAKKIPTLLLQHGVLANYYPYVDHPVDHYVVRGRFFYQRLSPLSQPRALIFDPHIAKDTIQKAAVEKKAIVFITAPNGYFWPLIKFDLASTLYATVKACAECLIPLIVRVHPLERIVDYENMIAAMMAGAPLASVDISYSQGGGLSELLQKAAVVVMFDSTVFLDCLKYNIPMISFDWYTAAFKQKLDCYDLFFNAENLQNLQELISLAARGLLPIRANKLNLFLENSSPEAFRSKLLQLVECESCTD